MKKIMLFIIALIPICLLFTVQVSTNFVKSSTYISVDRIVFEKERETINKTTEEPVTYGFPAKVVPLSATEQGIIYSSSDENVATVDEKGVITFYCFGRVVITATSKALTALGLEGFGLVFHLQILVQWKEDHKKGRLRNLITLSCKDLLLLRMQS